MTQRHFFQHVDVGFETMQIVQVDQRFKWLQPIVEGDEVIATMYIDSVDERFGADIVTSRNVLTDAKTGEEVMIAYTTLMGHGATIPFRWLGSGDRAGAAQARHPRLVQPSLISNGQGPRATRPSGFPT